MRWEELSGDQFAAAVKACDGVCLVALSVVERHGHHLPLGTDTYQGRGMAGVQTGIWWYADHPTHYSGNAAHGTTEAGERILDAIAQSIARAVRAIKADTIARQLQDEFFTAALAPS
jgi:creatinine amidohydrolase/Fe(II)-dependent formamide hydrolase-like protein